MRGLNLIGSLGRISVEDVLAGGKVFVSRQGEGPFVLEVTADQHARGTAWIESLTLPVVHTDDGTRINLGTSAEPAIDVIVLALRELEGSPTRTLVARNAPGPAEPWPERG